MKYVIIGNSAAGLSAAEEIRKRNTSSSLTIISDEGIPAYYRCLSTYYLSSDIDKSKLFFNNENFYIKNNIVLKNPWRIVKILPERNQLLNQDGEYISYDKLLIASGSNSIIPEICNVKNEGIYFIHKFSDVKRIMSKIPTTTQGVILGDGLVSIQTAIALTKAGIKISIVGIGDRILAKYLDFKEASSLQNIMEENGINIQLKNTITEIIKDKSGKINKVRLNDGKIIETDMIISAVGVKPAIDFLEGSSVEKNSGITVNDYLQTSVENIYAAGDVTEANDLITGISTVSPLWTNATIQGRIAGINMSGEKKKYQGSLKLNSINIFGTPIICGGITNSKEKCYEVHHLKSSPNKYMKLVIKDDILVGYTLMGDIFKAGVLTSIMTGQQPLKHKKSDILNGKFNTFLG